MARFLSFVNMQLQCSDTVCVACVYDQHSVKSRAHFQVHSNSYSGGSVALNVPGIAGRYFYLVVTQVFFFYSISEAWGHQEEFSLCCRKKKAFEIRTYRMYIPIVFHKYRVVRLVKYLLWDDFRYSHQQPLKRFWKYSSALGYIWRFAYHRSAQLLALMEVCAIWEPILVLITRW